MLRKDDLCPIRYARICKSSGEEVPYSEIVKGYQYRKGDYVVLSNSDFKKASPKKTQTIEILEFTNQKEIDVKYFQKPYYLEPEKEASKVYMLLREALNKTQKVGVGKIVIRNTEHLAVIKSEEDVLILNEIRYSSEIRSTKELSVPKKENISEQEIDMAVKLIDQLTKPFEPQKFRDEYTEELKKLIAEKAKGKTPSYKEISMPPPPSEVEDILGKLRESLKESQHGGHSHI